MAIDIQNLQQWQGRTEQIEDTVSTVPIRALAATLDLPEGELLVDQPLRPCWHWLYFLPIARQSNIGEDGHPYRGGFLPPVELPRRMWAGSQLEFLAPLQAGTSILRTSRIAEVSLKEGRTGPLVFVKVNHQIESAGRICVRETQDIVYREMPSAGEAPPKGVPAPADKDWSREVTPSDVLLFRYSALTFNGHRIHYDRRYVTQVEGYPGLVVHGPLIATLLLDLLHRERPFARVKGYSFKAMKPLFDTASFQVCGRQEQDGVRLWAVTPDGEIAMDATAQIA